MPVFDTPEPIWVTIDHVIGYVRIVAGDPGRTSVEVRPSDESRAADARGAERTRVEYAAGRLLVRGPKQRSLSMRADSIDVTIELPAGSHVQGDSAMGSFGCEGTLGDCRLKTAMGDIRCDETAGLQAATGYGDVSVERVLRDADVSTGSGEIRIGEVAGKAFVRNSNGDIRIGEVAGDLMVKAANGSVTVDRARSSVNVKTANGAVRVGGLERGATVLATGAGELEIGICEGAAAWLDLNTRFGAVHNSLEPADDPGQSTTTVDVRASTSFGDIVIQRSPARSTSGGR